MEPTAMTPENLRAEAKWHRDVADHFEAAAAALERNQPFNGSSRPIESKSPDNSGVSGRVQQLRQFLAKHPGSKRKQIIAGTSIPVGTIGYLLKAKNGFEKRNAKWYNANDPMPKLRLDLENRQKMKSIEQQEVK
jgi:hypothetical protein